MEIEFIENGKRVMLTNNGTVRKGEYLWYDGMHVLTVRFGSEKLEIEFKSVSKGGDGSKI